MAQSPSDFEESHRFVETLAESNIYIKVKNKTREDNLLEDSVSRSNQSDFKKMMEARDEADPATHVKRDDQARQKKLVNYLASMQSVAEIPPSVSHALNRLRLGELVLNRIPPEKRSPFLAKNESPSALVTNTTRADYTGRNS